MERRSRVNKYKDLRNSLNEELNKMVEPEPAEEAKQTAEENKTAEETDLADLDELIRQNEELLGQGTEKIAEPAKEEKENKEPEPETVEKPVEPVNPKEDASSDSDAGVFDFFLDDDTQDAQDNYAEQDFDIDSLDADDNLSVGDIPDDFLGQTINEAKQYSMNKGERSALDTTSAIIDELTRDPQVPAAGTKETENEPPVPEIADLMKPEGENSDAEEHIEVNSDIEKLLNEPDDKFNEDIAAKKQELPKEVEKEENNEEPSFEPEEEKDETVESAEPANKQSEQTKEAETADEENQRDNDLGGGYFDEDEEDNTPNLDKISQILSSPESDTDPVVELKPQPEPETDTKNDLKAINDLTAKLDKEQIMRTDLEEQTKQMQLDLDQLGDDVTTVNDKVNKTNKVLNSILVILIIALVLILGVVAYWALSERGVLPTGTIVEDNPVLTAETVATYLLKL